GAPERARTGVTEPTTAIREAPGRMAPKPPAPPEAADIRAQLQSGMTVYRSERPRVEGALYASDPGDLGRGKYYTTEPARAQAMGGVQTTAQLQMQNPLILDMEDAYKLADQYQTVRGTPEARLAGAQYITEALRAQGYDGLVAVRRDRKTGEVREMEIVDFREAPQAPARAAPTTHPETIPGVEPSAVEPKAIEDFQKAMAEAPAKA